MDELPKDLLPLLCCPKCRRPVSQEGGFLVCTQPECGLRYPVKDGIPVMLVEEARPPESSAPGGSPRL